jgi:hypothetical protein
MHSPITLDRQGSVEKTKGSLKVGGNYALVWIDKYLGRTPNMKLKILRNIYEVVM